MSQATEQWKTFGINSAWVSAYVDAQAASWVSMPLVAGSTLELGSTEAEVRDGEGFLEYVWYHTLTGRLTLRCKQWVMRVLEIISGNPVSSAAGVDKIEFGLESELSPPLVRFKLKVKAVDAADTAGYVTVIVYKAQCKFPSIGMEEVTPSEVTIEASCLSSSYDNLGTALPAKAYGRLEAVDTT